MKNVLSGQLVAFLVYEIIDSLVNMVLIAPAYQKLLQLWCPDMM
jgi:hypothetical protein